MTRNPSSLPLSLLALLIHPFHSKIPEYLDPTPTSPSDHSQSQLAQQQALLSEAQQQRPTRTGCLVRSFPTQSTSVGAGAPPPSNNPFSRTVNPPPDPFLYRDPSGAPPALPAIHPLFSPVGIQLTMRPLLRRTTTLWPHSVLAHTIPRGLVIFRLTH